MNQWVSTTLPAIELLLHSLFFLRVSSLGADHVDNDAIIDKLIRVKRLCEINIIQSQKN